MAKPWEKYQEEVKVKPWEKYQEEVPQEQPKSWLRDILPQAISELATQGEAQNQVGSMSRGVSDVLSTVDKYTGAPIRKFVTEVATGKDLETAPSGKEQAEMMGAPTQTYGEAYGVPSYLGGNISPADIYGMGLEAVQDPFLLGAGAFKAGEKISGLAKAGTAAKEAKLPGAIPISGVSELKGEVSPSKLGGEISPAFEIKPPQSLEELKSWKAPEGLADLPNKGRLHEIQQIAPDLQVKPLNYHYQMFDNPKAMKELKLQFENLPTENAKQIAEYNQAMLNESASKVKSTISDLNNGQIPLQAPEQGANFLNNIRAQYNAEKEMLGPEFQQFQELSLPLDKTATSDLAQHIIENTKLNKLTTIDPETGAIEIASHRPKAGMTAAEVNELKAVVDDLKDGASFQDIQNMREYLRKHIDYSNPKATAEIEKARSIMLDQLESMVDNHPIRDTFRRYAINERARENVEKIIGGKIESLDQMYAANPDRIVDRIFSNPNYTEVVSQYIGPDKIYEMALSKVNQGLMTAFDSAGNFAPHTARNYLTKNRLFIDRNLGTDVYQRLSALVDNGYYAKRFLDEVNPSGTAASLAAALSPTKMILSGDITGAATKATIGHVMQMQEQKAASSFLDDLLRGVTDVAKDNAPLGKMLINKIQNGTVDLYKARALTTPVRVFVDEQDRAQFLNDINNSNMSPIDKAKKRSEMNKTQFIDITPTPTPSPDVSSLLKKNSNNDLTLGDKWAQAGVEGEKWASEPDKFGILAQMYKKPQSKDEFIQEGLNALPMAGGALGAVLGGGVGSIPGAGIGAMAGEGFKQLGEQFLLDKIQDPKENTKNLIVQSLFGGLSELPGNVPMIMGMAKKTPDWMKVVEGEGKTTPKLEAEDIGLKLKKPAISDKKLLKTEDSKLTDIELNRKIDLLREKNIKAYEKEHKPIIQQEFEYMMEKQKSKEGKSLNDIRDAKLNRDFIKKRGEQIGSENMPKETTLKDEVSKAIKDQYLRYNDNPETIKAFKQARVKAKELNVPYYFDETLPTPVNNPFFKGEKIGVERINISSTHGHTESFPWMDTKFQSSKNWLAKNKEKGKSVIINTSSDLIARDDYMHMIPEGSKVRMFMLPDNDHINRLIFPGNPSRKRLELAVKKMQENGIDIDMYEPTKSSVYNTLNNIAEANKITVKKYIQMTTGIGNFEELAKLLNLKD